MSSKVVVVTGGLGYIGSNIVAILAKAGFRVVAFDNLANSSESRFCTLQTVFADRVWFEKGDVRSAVDLSNLFEKFSVSVVVHCAGLKNITDSNARPLDYFDNNVGGTVELVKAMARYGVSNLIFSSSASVYGHPRKNPIPEDADLDPMSPYAFTKMCAEQLLASVTVSQSNFSACVLRYFNPVGAGLDGMLGEDRSDKATNLVPMILKVKEGDLDALDIYGGGLNTVDGSGVRDFIHVEDLALGHLSALSWLLDGKSAQRFEVFNLGVGRGISVLEMLKKCESIAGVSIPFRFKSPRSGEVAECFAEVDKAHSMLGWAAMKTIDEMWASALRYDSLVFGNERTEEAVR